MRALVVYESMFGNTQAIAQAVADGLRAGMTVDLVEVGAAPTVVDEGIDLLVVGGPTHAFGLSRPSTRQSAVEQADRSGNGVVSAKCGIREWLGAVRPVAGRAAVAFDTRVRKPRFPGSAARAAQRRMQRLGLRALQPPMTFYVEGGTGPLVEGERERARRWGERIGATLATALTP